MKTLTRTSAAFAGSALLLALVACAPVTSATPDPVDVAAAAPDWPRTVEIAGDEIEIPAPPERIVALSTETGDLALQLVGPGRVSAVARGSATEGAGNQLELASQVETVIETRTTPDPERILALDPDLVLLTGRHDGEQDAAALLADAGVPSLAFDAADFQTLDGISSSIETLGAALGSEDEAAEIVADMEERRAALAPAPAVNAGPRVMLLMARGGQQMIQPSSTLMSHLVEEAGGDVVGAANGAVPADPEHIVDVDPDVILVEDFRGAGLGPFQELLRAPALADVTAVAAGDVHLVSGQIASSTAGARAVEGLERIAELLR